MDLFIGHDVGTGGNKAVLVDLQGRVLSSHVGSLELDHPRPGWAEQDPERWWDAVCEGTRAVVGDRAGDVKGMAFAGQMLVLVPMDGGGRPTRPAISWLDNRGEEQARRLTRRLGGDRVVRALAGASPTGKDLVAKVAWIAEHEPEVHAATEAYGDATSYLVARCTGRVALDATGAGATGLFDPVKRRWSKALARLTGYPLAKVPSVLPSTEVAGRLTSKAASDLGLAPDLPVAMGMADIPAAAVGSGAVEPGDGHVYLGTSAWIAVTLNKPRHVPAAGIVSVSSAAPRGSLMIAEMETAGACRDWFETNMGAADLDELAAQAPPGCDGLVFCPWMFGERSPVPDSTLRGAFVNLSLEHGREHLARAVLEGVAYNLRWIIEEIDATGLRRPGLRAIGGGARSSLWLQIIADVCGESVSRVAEPRFAGASGAALSAAVATGYLRDVPAIKQRVRVERIFTPTPTPTSHGQAKSAYDRSYRMMRQIAPALSKAGRTRAGR